MIRLSEEILPVLFATLASFSIYYIEIPSYVLSITLPTCVLFLGIHP